MRSNTIPDFRDITVDFVTIYLWALYCPDSRTWLAQANSLILRWGLSWFQYDSTMIPRCRKTRWLERVRHGPACAHGDTACFRILTESGIYKIYLRSIYHVMASFKGIPWKKKHSDVFLTSLRAFAWTHITFAWTHIRVHVRYLRTFIHGPAILA